MKFKKNPCPHCGRMLGKLTPHVDICPDNPDVARAVREVFRTFDTAPTISEYTLAVRDHPTPMPSAQLLTKHMGPWRQIIDKMIREGVVSPRQKQNAIDWDHVRSEIVRLSRELYDGAYGGKIAPSTTEISRNSDIPLSTLYRYPYGGFDGLVRSIETTMGIKLERPPRSVYYKIRAKYAEKRKPKEEREGPSPRDIEHELSLPGGLNVSRQFQRVRPSGVVEVVSVLR